MKKVVLSLIMMIVAMTASAQQIAVVTSSGSTTMYQTLGDAISNAPRNSVIYLPAGGFQISDDVKITTKVTIIGVTHKANSDNAEGNTIISGNLYFNSGSSNSAVMGCYISGTVYIGYDDTEVNNILVKYCNVNAVNVKSNKCSGTKVNQNYIRSTCNFGGAEGTFTNNIMSSTTQNMTGGMFSNNIINSQGSWTFYYVKNVTVSNNIFLFFWNGAYSCSNLYGSNNMFCKGSFGDDCISLGLDNYDGVFKKNNGVSPTSEFIFIGDYAQYNGKVGIYCTDDGGTGFSDGAMPPVPYVSYKKIDEQTDAAGNLSVKIQVKSVSE